MKRMVLALGAALAMAALAPAARACEIDPKAVIALWPGVADMPTTRVQGLMPVLDPRSYNPGDPLPEDCKVRWSVDRRYGRIKDDKLTIVPGTPDGTELTVTGTIRTTQGPRKVEGKLFVIDMAKHLVAGNWRQSGLSCPGGAPAGAVALNELIFNARGEFKATWQPFESYVDYWGDYSFDPATGAISLKPTGGNHVPKDATLSGTVTVNGNELRTKGLSFGQPRGPALPADCEVTFKRSGT
ncbi:hypothetical protein QO010_002795 [Caulobacter ginsengisoli]|uniref:Lipoprotein n=1 Tax=Caulobacter ginsengisoli TaxID=400775 RepID=A0ABU0ISL9_9CAUL|nr:hypothetical protein [Caulobacter ginsengisoli]MDQ0465011.1 hypothetical protein [Caulobacter ginsengisoli]